MDFRDPPYAFWLPIAVITIAIATKSAVLSFLFVTSYSFCLGFHAIKAFNSRHNEHKADKGWNDLAFNRKSKINNLFIFMIYTTLATLEAFAATNLADSSSTLV